MRLKCENVKAKTAPEEIYAPRDPHRAGSLPRFNPSTLQPFNPSALQRFNAHSAFTLIEMIGVLAVLALLAVAVIPQIIKRVDQAASTKEKADLDGMAEALTQYILRNKTITNYAGIATTIANEMALPLNAITDNPRRYTRAFLTDQNFLVDGMQLPYSQSPNGAAKPVSARVMIVSSLHRPVPIVSSDNMADADFQAIWDTPEGAIPAGAAWAGFGGTDAVHIKKLNLEPLFHHLILIDHDDANAAPFSIDGSSTMNVPPGGLGWNRYYLDGTVLSLRTNATVQTRYLLQRSISFVFEDGAWRGMIQGAGRETDSTDNSTLTASNFVNTANAFYGSSLNPTAEKGSSQTSVLVAMYTFMFDYVFWANQCPHFDWHGYDASSLATLPEWKMLNDMGQSCNGCGSIDSISGGNGIIK